MHRYEDLIDLFHACFFDEYNTILVKGGEEPLYVPGDPNKLYFARGFFASALHETAHWLIAGAERRKQVDFGYWYEPDGRSAEQQALFQQVEVKPQALEWILSQAAGSRFYLSFDNTSGEAADPEPFKNAVFQQVKHYCERGLSKRAEAFRLALARFYKRDERLNIEDFNEGKIAF